MKILFVGHGRCGKDFAGEWFDENSTLSFGQTTSYYLCRHVAQKLGCSWQSAYDARHDPGMREVWHQTGREVRAKDPAKLIKEALEQHEVSGGIRDLEEVEAARPLCDLIIWIKNPRVEVDKTIHFTEAACDLVILNDGSKDLFRSRLTRLAKSLGVYKEVPCGVLNG